MQAKGSDRDWHMTTMTRFTSSRSILSSWKIPTMYRNSRFKLVSKVLFRSSQYSRIPCSRLVRSIQIRYKAWRLLRRHLPTRRLPGQYRARVLVQIIKAFRSHSHSYWMENNSWIDYWNSENVLIDPCINNVTAVGLANLADQAYFWHGTVSLVVKQDRLLFEWDYGIFYVWILLAETIRRFFFE